MCSHLKTCLLFRALLRPLVFTVTHENECGITVMRKFDLPQ